MTHDRKPRPWRDSGNEVRALFFFDALPSFGPTYSLTLRLSDVVEALARAHGSDCLDFLHRRIRDSLRRVLGRAIEFCLTLEESKGRLHLHGWLACEETEYKLVRRALKTAGGEWPKGARQFQLVMRKDPNIRWAGYAIKDNLKAQPGFRRFMKRLGVRRSQWLVRFEGRALSATQGLRRAAKARYQAAVDSVVEFRRAGAGLLPSGPSDRTSASPAFMVTKQLERPSMSGSGQTGHRAAWPHDRV